MLDHYKTLGISRTSTLDEIRAAVDRLNANACGPRSWGTDPPPSGRAVSEAHYWLGDATRRQEYDRTLVERESKQAEVDRMVSERQDKHDQGVAGLEAGTLAQDIHADWYRVLGLARDASQAEIESSFEQRKSENATVRPAQIIGFRKQIFQAYAVLRSPVHRAEYDRLRAAPEVAAAMAYHREAGVQTNSEKADKIMVPLSFLLFFALFVWIAVAGYGWLNNLGWITHGENASVQIDGNWMMGEYRPCVLYPASADPGVPPLDCTQRTLGEPHLLAVTFWGRIDRNEISSWKCQRQHGVLDSTDSLVCWATG